MIDARDREHPAVLAVLDDAFDRYRQRRGAHEKLWMLSLLFWAGHQWIKWNTRDASFARRTLPAYVPTPVTNKFAETGERLVSVISRVEPNWAFVPASEQEQDLAAADVAKKLEPIIAEENGLPYLREAVARWMTACGNGGLLSGAMPARQRPLPIAEALGGLSPGAGPGLAEPPREGGVGGFGVVPPLNGGPPAAPPAPLPAYRLYTDVISPFELFVNLGVPRLEDQPKILIVQPRDPEWVQSVFGVEVEPDKAPQHGLRYLEALGYLGLDRGLADWSGGNQDHPRVYVKRGYVRPNDDFPDGLYVCGAGGQVLEEPQSLPQTGEGEPYIPLVWFTFDAFPGAFFGRSPMFDLISKQAQRNRYESLLELQQMRMAAPVWLRPRNTSTSGFTGEPGGVIEYDPLGPNAAKPERIPGEPIASASLALMNKQDADMEALASTFEALKGQAPFSGAPGIVVQQLLEQGLSRFGPCFRGLGEGWRQWMKQQLELFRVYGTTPRMLKAVGDSARWQVQAFTGADLARGADVRLESASTIPRSEQVETQKALATLDAGLVDPADPEVKWALLKRLGVRDLAKAVDEQRLQAAKENERLARGEMVPVEPLLDDDAIHMACHRRFALSDAGDAVIEQMVPAVDPLTSAPRLNLFTGAPILEPQAIPVREFVKQHLAAHEANLAQRALTAALSGQPVPGAEAPAEGAPGAGGGPTAAEADAMAPADSVEQASADLPPASVGVGA